jgi:hypothetical protein
MHPNSTQNSIQHPNNSLLFRDKVQLTETQESVEFRTQGEMESQVSDAIRRYALEYFGRGPKDVHSHLLGDLLLVRMSGVLTIAE